MSEALFQVGELVKVVPPPEGLSCDVFEVEELLHRYWGYSSEIISSELVKRIDIWYYTLNPPKLNPAMSIEVPEFMLDGMYVRKTAAVISDLLLD